MAQEGNGENKPFDSEQSLTAIGGVSRDAHIIVLMLCRDVLILAYFDQR